jgi:CRISPR-associated endoribonuclease Cas6
MRYKIEYSGKSILPNNNQNMLNSYIHKCLGENNIYHDAKSNYSISMLYGGTLDKINKKIIVEDNIFFVVSSFDEDFINLLIGGIADNPILTDNLILSSIECIDEYIYDGYNHFRTFSPFLIKGSDGRGVTIDNFNGSCEKFGEFLKPIVKNKLQKISENLKLNLKFDIFDIKIEWCHSANRSIKNGCVKTNNCGFTLHSDNQTASLLYNIGIGQSTGAGFGCIYKAENSYMYIRNKKATQIAEQTHENTQFSSPNCFTTN